MALREEPVPPFRRQRWETALDAGWFDAAISALREWQVHRGAGISVVADGPLVVGTCVAMSAPLPVGFVDATCRIVALVDEPDRFGFAYGTLSPHPEMGEEAFIIHGRRSPRFTVETMSRPVHPLARLVPPLAHRLQAAACDRYLRAMQRATSAP